MNEAKVTLSVPLVTFVSILVFSFFILKITHVISWSWVWVLSPLWTVMLCEIALVLGFMVWYAFIGKKKYTL